MRFKRNDTIRCIDDVGFIGILNKTDTYHIYKSSEYNDEYEDCVYIINKRTKEDLGGFFQKRFELVGNVIHLPEDLFTL